MRVPQSIPLLLTLIVVALSAASGPKTGKEASAVPSGPAVLWRDPGDISTANLLYGSGGEAHQPHAPFTFIAEDMDGTNPKFDVHDADGVKWKVKMGAEAKPEVAASRFVWASGYFTNEDYYLEQIQVKDLPHLHRGQNFVGKDGSIHGVRLKRSVKGQEKIGTWQWASNPFTGTRELNGLRVLMAVMNNWDLKDMNNAVYEVKHDESGSGPERIYMVTDLGASFGTNGYTVGLDASRGNLESYRKSKFITKRTPETVDFETPSRPALIETFNLPTFIHREDLRWIGKDIPRADAKWLGGLLSHLSPEQVRDAFLAAGYSQQDAGAFAAYVQARISELNSL